VRVLIVDTCYPAFLAAHYAASPGLEHRSYREQWRTLMDTFFGTADSYSHFLAELGHEAREVVVNCEPLQRAWAAENGIGARRTLPRRFRRELVVAQAEAFEPDVVYVQDLSALTPDTLRRLRAHSRLLAGQIASELPPHAQLEPFDLILTSFPHYVSRLREAGTASEYLRIGFDPRVLDRLGAPAETGGAVFVGALGRLQHARGNTLLERAARRVPIDFWGYGVDEWPPDSPVRTRYRGEAWGIEMLRVLGGARIALNRHIDVAEDFANNMRLFEATGVGTLLLTDERRNLSALFESQKEVVTYASEDELVERVRHYLAHDDEREAIAAAGQRRTLAEHTYAHRMSELVEVLGRYLR
jgi:spore maturation protein CgeB